MQISIADGAVVWLGGVSINADGTMTGEYAGITCLGNATINLADGTTNTVRGMADDYSGIFVPHNDTDEDDEGDEGDEGDEYTLTIRGTGTLNAFGGQNSAGIGANSRYDSGNIVIAGGIINATGGGESAAGIGSGYMSTSQTNFCGDITISGGTITANGGNYAAGIGSGYYGKCGSIEITTGVTKVTATKGSGAPNSIGPGQNGSCNSVTIGDTQYWGWVSTSMEDGYKNSGDTYLTQSPLVYPAP